MTFKPISAGLLQKAAEDAEKRNQYGLIIWPSEAKWRSLHRFVDSSSPILPKIADYLNRNQMCWVNFTKGEITTKPQSNYALIVPTSKLVISSNYCNQVTRLCPHNSGIPITTVPSMHLSAIHLNPSLS